jgi:acyl-CoA thioesterase I
VRPVILVVGDSLSAAYRIPADTGWVRLLADRLDREGYDYRVVNASIPGDTTAGGLARLPAALARYHPAVVVLELGANDGLRGLPLDPMRDNLAQMIELARQTGARVLLLGVRMPPNYGPIFTQRFQTVYRDLARSERVPLVPELLKGVAEYRELMQADGLHPTAAAEPKVLANVWPVLTPLLVKSIAAAASR